MEVSPIAGIRVMPVVKVRPVDPELTAYFDIEAAVRPDEDSYSGNGKKAAGAEESEDEDDVIEGLQEEAEEGAGLGPALKAPGSQISFFA